MIKVRNLNALTVTSEPLLEIIRPHFDQISPVQWANLSNDTWDIETRDILLSLFLNIMQTLTAHIMRLVQSPQEVRLRAYSDEDTSRVSRNYTIELEDSIGYCFGLALSLPSLQDVDKCEDSQALTVLVENELSLKVNSILSGMSQRTQDAHIIIPATLSSMEATRKLLNRAKYCLQKCLSSVRCSCVRSVASRPVSEELDEPQTSLASEDSETGPCHCCFMLFARRSFKKMQKKLERNIDTTSASSVRSVPLHSPSPITTPRDPSPVVSVLAGSPSLVVSPRSAELDFEHIRNHVNEVFQDIHLAKSENQASQQRLDQFLQSNSVNRLAEKLVKEIHCHFIMLGGMKESNNLGQEESKKLEDIKQKVELEVIIYIQELCKFMQQKDPIQDFNNFDLFEMCMEKPVILSVSPQTSPVRSQASVHSFDSIKRDVFSAAHPKASVPSFVSEDVPAIVLKTPQMEKAGSSPVTVSSQISKESALSIGQYMTKAVVLSLMKKIFKNAPVTQRNKDLFRTALDRLCQKALEEIDIQDAMGRKMEEILTKIVDDVLSSLKEEYGSPKILLDTLINDTDAFDATVMNHLKFHIRTRLNKKRCLPCRVFKFICKPFTKFFGF